MEIWCNRAAFPVKKLTWFNGKFNEIWKMQELLQTSWRVSSSLLTHSQYFDLTTCHFAVPCSRKCPRMMGFEKSWIFFTFSASSCPLKMCATKLCKLDPLGFSAPLHLLFCFKIAIHLNLQSVRVAKRLCLSNAQFFAGLSLAHV